MQSSEQQRPNPSLVHTTSTSSSFSQTSTLRAPSPPPLPLVRNTTLSRQRFVRAYSDDQLRLARNSPRPLPIPPYPSATFDPLQRHSFAADTPPPPLSADYTTLQSGLPVFTSLQHPKAAYDHQYLVDPALPPPSYHTHHFPPTPPPLDLTGNQASPFVSSFDQHLAQPPDVAPPPDAAPPNQGGFGSRFPRWRGWLEKRALERHYARMDAAAASATAAAAAEDSIPGHPAPPSRKKSWGAWINDPDALSDEEESTTIPDQTEQAAELPPLHVHHYGSRFLPHLQAQPLCSALIELPPAPADPARRIRQILLLGTSEGLYAFRRRAKIEVTNDKWNQDVQCIPIWTGLGIYQMCILASKDQPSSAMPFGGSSSSSRSSARLDRQSSGILLALTSPALARPGAVASTLMQLSAHAGTILENVATSGSTSSNTSQSGGHGSGLFGGAIDISDALPTANFGPAAGGGSGRAVPQAASGTVRMWNLEAIRKILLYALDYPSPQLPLDLASDKPAATKERKGKLGAILKRTFAPHKQNKGKSTLKPSSDGRGGTIDPFISDAASPIAHGAATPIDSAHHSDVSSEHLPSSRRSSLHSTSRQASYESLAQPDNPNGLADEQSRVQRDPALASVMGLALGSVPIKAPASSTGTGSQNNSSFSSLFADDSYQFAGKQSHAKSKDRDSASANSPKGVLFFSVHEAARDTKGAGTWYLALATARSVMVYEAAVPKRGCARSWTWVKEFYAPFPVKAIAFAPTSVSEDLLASTTPAFPVSLTGSTKLKVSAADGPLSPSRKPTAQSVDRNILSKELGISRTQQSIGRAAPVSWLRADLCIFLSFGRRAVIVRVSDSDVREFELQPLGDVVGASSNMTGSGAPSHISLQPAGLALETEHSDRSRPSSMVGHGSYAANAGTPSHTRAASVEQKLKEHILDRRSRRHNWIGFTSIQAHIRVRQHREADATTPSANKTAFVKDGTAASLSSSGTNSAVVPQNVSFDRRVSRLDLDPESLRAYEAVQAEDSSDSEGETPPAAAAAAAAAGTATSVRKYALMDRGPLPSGGSRFQQAKERNAGSDLVSVKLALVSRGSVTHVLPLPLPADLARPTPLGVMQWSETPNSVTGWARVLGVERARSTGATAVGSNSGSGPSTPTTPIQLSPSLSNATRPLPLGRRKSVSRNRLGLHVSVTCIAYLASKFEVKQISFQVPVDVDFQVSRSCELELVPATWHKRPPPPPSLARTQMDEEEDATSHVQELEYLCGSLLTLTPPDLNLAASGSQSTILPLYTDESCVQQLLFPELAGDGAVIAFDWRGANDYRIFTVGVQD